MEELPTLTKQLPAQILEEDVVVVQTSTETTEKATLGSIVLSIVTTVLIAGSLSMVWGLVGALQNLAIMAFVNVNYPGNAHGLINQIHGLANLDLLPDFFIEPWLNLFTKFEESHSEETMKRKLSQRFYQMGFESSNPIINMN